MSRLLVIYGLLILLVLTGCVPGTGSETEEVSGLPTPTIHPFFQQAVATPVEVPPTPVPTTVADTPVSPTTGPQVITPTLTAEPQPDILQTELITVTVYDDTLNSGWQMLEVPNVEVNLSDTSQVHNGRSSIAITPLEDFSAQLFVVSEDAVQSYPQDQVVAIYFWLNSGDDSLVLEDLAFTVLGSNDYPYYVPGDESAYVDGEFAFEETALYFLGLNQTIPPETWVEVEVLLDNLVFDPVYNYVTGFYIKNDAGYTNTFYVDDISFLMLADETTTQPVDTAEVGAAETAVPPVTTPDDTITPTVTPTRAAPASDEACVVTPPQGWALYTIVAGDTISNLALQRDVTEEEVIQVNCLTPGEPLSVGQQIYLPPLSQLATSTPTPAP